MTILGLIIARLASVYIGRIIFSCNRKVGVLFAITLIFRSTAARQVISN